MIKYKNSFRKACETGTKVLILKAIKDCDCFDSDDLLNSEPDPKCPKCFGTGKTRTVIMTTKIRHDSQSSNTGTYYEKLNLQRSINELRIFFFPEEYHYITTEEIIATIDENGDITKLYEVVNVEKLNANDFQYYTVIGEKINYITKVEINDR